MNNISLNLTKDNFSFFEDFVNDRMSEPELFNTLGGIEPDDIFDESSNKMKSFNIPFDPIVPNCESTKINENIKIFSAYSFSPFSFFKNMKFF